MFIPFASPLKVMPNSMFTAQKYAQNASKRAKLKKLFNLYSGLNDYAKY